MSSGESDQLKSEELEALLNAANTSEEEGAPKASDSAAETVEPSVGTDPAGTENAELNAEELLEQVEANLASAVDPELPADSPAGESPSSATGAPLPEAAEPFELQEFDDSGSTTGEQEELQALEDVELDVRIELGQAELLIEEVLQLREGSVVPLDKLAGDPVDILVNGRLIARGEVLVLNENFCVRVAEILTPDV